ncbi:unnamed protein product [Orchesella dallaii]|uniref:Uncharacterized protein n=1 Tax=Orchesella dallaii TaxID=48710 RepID=A0ABP1S8F4_9HEXA
MSRPHFWKRCLQKLKCLTLTSSFLLLLNVPVKSSLSSAAEIDVNVDSLLRDINDTNDCLIHIISQSVRFYFQLPQAPPSSYSIRQLRRVEYLHNTSLDTWDNDDIFFPPVTIQRDNENPAVPFNPCQMKRAPTCVYAILLFAFNEIEITMNGGFFNTRSYIPYFFALNELKQFYNFYSKEKDFKWNTVSEPYQLFTLHVSLGSQRLTDQNRIEIHETLHFLNIHNGILDCVDNNIENVAQIHTCNATYFCIHCFIPWQFISVNVSTFINFTTFGSFSKLIGTPKMWTVIKTDELNTIDWEKRHNKPFILSSKENNVPFQFVIFSILSFESNSSIYILEKEDRVHRLNEIFPEKRMLMDYKLEITPMLTGVFQQNQFWQTSMVSSNGYNFITRYSTDHLTFAYYFQPFQIELWIALIVYLPILSVLTHIFLIVTNCNKTDFNAYFFAYSSMLEYCYYIPNYLFRMDSVRIVLGLWLLISCIFTNAYKGLAITGVTAPAEKTSVKTMAELVDDNIYPADEVNSSDSNTTFRFRILSPFTVEYLETWKRGDWDIRSAGIPKIADENSNSTNNNNSEPDPLTVDSYTYFRFPLETFNEFWKLDQKYDACTLMQDPKLFPTESFKPGDQSYIRRCRLFSQLTDPRRYIVPTREFARPQFSKSFEIAIEKEFIEGNERIVYIDYEEKIKGEYEYLSGHYRHKAFFIGNQSFLMDWTVWQFDNGRGSRLPAIFQLLFENGIYNRLRSFYKNMEYYGVRNEYTRIQAFKETYERVKKLNLKSNLQTVFYMFFCGIIVSVLWLSVEACHLFVVDFMKYVWNLHRNSFSLMLRRMLNVLRLTRQSNVFN